jgi:hypothetical protein
MLHVRIEMRLGGWAASSENTDADTGVGGWQELMTRSMMGGPACRVLLFRLFFRNH